MFRKKWSLALNGLLRCSGFRRWLTAGTCTYRVDSETVLEFPFTLGEWVELEHHFDLEANVMNLYVDGCFRGQLPYDGATIGGLNFYSYYGNGLQGFATAFVDDLSFVPCDSAFGQFTWRLHCGNGLQL